MSNTSKNKEQDKSTKDEIEKLVDLVSDIAATCGYEGDIMSKGQRVRFTQALTDLIDKRERNIVAKFIEWQYKEGWIDSDWYTEQPHLFDAFFNELKGESDGTA